MKNINHFSQRSFIKSTSIVTTAAIGTTVFSAYSNDVKSDALRTVFGG